MIVAVTIAKKSLQAVFVIAFISFRFRVYKITIYYNPGIEEMQILGMENHCCFGVLWLFLMFPDLLSFRYSSGALRSLHILPVDLAGEDH